MDVLNEIAVELVSLPLDGGGLAFLYSELLKALRSGVEVRAQRGRGHPENLASEGGNGGVVDRVALGAHILLEFGTAGDFLGEPLDVLESPLALDALELLKDGFKLGLLDVFLRPC